MGDPMADSDKAAVGRRWRVIRFSIEDLCILTTSAAVGLAARRLPNLTWLDVLLIVFATFCMLGVLSQALVVRRLLVSTQNPVHALRGPLLAEVAIRSFAGIAIIGITLEKVIQASQERPFFHLPTESEIALQSLLDGTMFLAILLIYPPSASIQGLRLSRLWRGVIVLATCSVALVMVLVFAAEAIGPSAFTHLAILKLAHPEAWTPGSIEFGSLRPATIERFAGGSLLALSLWIMTAASYTQAVIRRPTAAHFASYWQAAAEMTLFMLTLLLAWGFHLFVTQISPFLGPFVGRQPAGYWSLAALFVAAGALWWTRTALLARGGLHPLLVHLRPGQRFAYEWLLVMALPVAWWLSRQYFVVQLIRHGSDSVWEKLESLVTLIAKTPEDFLALAVLAGFIQTAWRRWRGSDVAGAMEIVPISDTWPIRMTVTHWLLLAAAAPTVMWLCFVLWTWPGHFPGESWLFLKK